MIESIILGVLGEIGVNMKNVGFKWVCKLVVVDSTGLDNGGVDWV